MDVEDVKNNSQLKGVDSKIPIGSVQSNTKYKKIQ